MWGCPYSGPKTQIFGFYCILCYADQPIGPYKVDTNPDIFVVDTNPDIFVVDTNPDIFAVDTNPDIFIVKTGKIKLLKIGSELEKVHLNFNIDICQLYHVLLLEFWFGMVDFNFLSVASFMQAPFCDSNVKSCWEILCILKITAFLLIIISACTNW